MKVYKKDSTITIGVGLFLTAVSTLVYFLNIDIMTPLESFVLAFSTGSLFISALKKQP